MALAKTFPFSERWKLQFRADFFNVFDRVSFLDDDAILNDFQKTSSSAFGAITATSDPRIGQLALKLIF